MCVVGWRLEIKANVNYFSFSQNVDFFSLLRHLFSERALERQPGVQGSVPVVAMDGHIALMSQSVTRVEPAS